MGLDNLPFTANEEDTHLENKSPEITGEVNANSDILKNEKEPSTNTVQGFPQGASSAAVAYIQKGLKPIPVDYRSKKTSIKDFNNCSVTESNIYDYFPVNQNRNIGVLNGQASGGLVDVDLDSAEARAAAPYILPDTGMIFGRASSKGSHRMYRCTPSLDVAQEAFTDLNHQCKGDKEPESKMLVEMRGNGGYTVCPPSIHKDTGELITWERFNEPATVELSALRRDVLILAAVALLARYWVQKGTRNSAYMALVGALHRAGVPPERIRQFIKALAHATNDEEMKERVKIVDSTVAKHAKDQNTTGWPTLIQLLGSVGGQVVNQVRQWLNCGDSGDSGSNQEIWMEPLPLDENLEVMPFPTQVLPDSLQTLVNETARSMNCPPDFAGVIILTLAGGAIGNARNLALTSTHTQPPCLFVAYAGRPGSTKSAPLKLLRGPFDKAAQRYSDEFSEAKKAWGQQPKKSRGPEPVLKRNVVSDTTTESLMKTLAENPRGVVMIQNELTALVTSMNQYKGGRGHDRQIFLNLWDGQPINKDRVSHEGQLSVSNPFLSIIGSIQPDVLGCLRGESSRGSQVSDDGWTDRFLIVYPVEKEAVGEQWLEVSQCALDAWEKIIQSLTELETRLDGNRLNPQFVKLTDCGKKAWEQFTVTHAAEMNKHDFPSYLWGPWSKLKGYGARIALIIHLLRWAAREVTSEDVDGESMHRAALLVDYFKSHTRKVRAVMDSDLRVAGAKKILTWALNNQKSRFQKREVYQVFKGTYKTVDALDPCLRLLEMHGFIRNETGIDRGGPGRKPSPYYEIHPSIVNSTTHNPHNPQNESNHCDLGDGEETDDDDGGGNYPTPVPDPNVNPSGTGVQPPTPLTSLTPMKPYASYDLVVDADGLERVGEAVAKASVVGIDLQTTGLNTRVDKIRLVAVSCEFKDIGTKIYLIDCSELDPSPLWTTLANRKLVFHDANLDLMFLAKRGFKAVSSVTDTMLLAKLLNAGTTEQDDLNSCCRKWLNQTLSLPEQKKHWCSTLTDDQLTYAANCAAVLLPLSKAMEAKINDDGLSKVAEIERQCQPAVIWMGQQGVPFSKDAWQSLAHATSSEADQLLQQLNSIAPKKPDGSTGDWNWGSPGDVRQALKLVGYDVSDTSHGTLATLHHQLPQSLQRFRNVNKRKSWYETEWLHKHLVDDSRIYPSWLQLGAVSGRMSCSGPNIQQMPRGEVRQIIAAPVGRVLIRGDFSQIELRIAAKLTSDPAMLAAFQQGHDLHEITAQILFSTLDVNKDQRNVGKEINFAMLYGMGLESLKKKLKSKCGLEVDKQQVTNFRNAFFENYGGLRAWHEQVKNDQSKQTKETRTLTGRRMLLVASTTFNQRLYAPVQGTGADGLKKALGLLWDRRCQLPTAFPILANHDEIVIEADADQEESAISWLKTAMVDGMSSLIAPVPVIVDIKAAKTWGGSSM